jgi:hypothetical protein
LGGGGYRIYTNGQRVYEHRLGSGRPRVGRLNHLLGDNMDIKKLFGAFPALSSQIMTLRKIVEQDIEEVFALYSNDSIFQYCGILVKKNKATVL